MNRFKIIFPIFIIIIFTQCIHDEYKFNNLDSDIEINAGFLTPLAYGTLNFGDIISEFDSTGFIGEDADGLLLITYADSLFSFVANDLLEIPSQDFIEVFIESDFSFPAGIWPTGDTIKIGDSQKFPFTFGKGEKLDSMILDQGSMIFNITSEFQHTGNIFITCPDIRLNNVPFSQTIVIDDASGGFNFNSSFPLDGYTIYLEDSVGNDTAFMPVDFRVELISSGAAINASDKIDITATIDNLNFDAIFGYIGDYELLSENGEIPLGFFEDALDGYIRFEEPIINLNIGNSYGLPTAISISRFTGFKSDIDSIELILDATMDTFGYAYPTLADYNNSDIYKDTTISINATNSNLSEFLAFLPSSLEYSLTAKSNPDGEGASYNFVTDDSKVDIDLEFILPLWFKADSFALEDTMEMNFFENADFVERVSVLLEVSNGLPLDIDFQVYFLDSNYNHVDTLFSANSTPIISSGIVDPITNTVTSPKTKTSLVDLTNDRMVNLEKVKYGIVRAGLKTPSDTNGELISVKFFTDYSIEFNLSVSIDIKAEL